jgi:hypothetical protein
VFSSDEQLARVCRAFCSRARLSELWTSEGPTAQAMSLLERDGGPLSSGERMVLLVAWSIWNGSGHLSLSDVLHQLDGISLAMLGKLLLAAAQGGGAIDAWIIEAEEMTRRRQPGHA